jgi:hypothetical protein
MIEVVAIALGLFCVAIFVAHAVDACLARGYSQRPRQGTDLRGN